MAPEGEISSGLLPAREAWKQRSYELVASQFCWAETRPSWSGLHVSFHLFLGRRVIAFQRIKCVTDFCGGLWMGLISVPINLTNCLAWSQLHSGEGICKYTCGKVFNGLITHELCYEV